MTKHCASASRSARAVWTGLLLMPLLLAAEAVVFSDPPGRAGENRVDIEGLVQSEMQFLKGAQGGDGTWGRRSGVTGLTILALEGLAGCDGAVDRARASLAKVGVPEGTYDCALSIIGLLSGESPQSFDPTCGLRVLRTPEYRPYLTALVTELAQRFRTGGGAGQRVPPAVPARGGWTYLRGEGTCDLSNTAYAVWALSSASSAGLFRPGAEFWLSVRRAVQSYALEDSTNSGMGFSYSERRAGVASRSMTVDALCALHYLEQGLARDSDSAQQSPGEPLRRRALEWVTADLRDGGDEPWEAQDHIYYHLFGLGRCMALEQSRTIGGVNWYERGVRVLASRQRGRLSRGKEVEHHAFSLLFLRSDPARWKGSSPVVTGR